MRRRRSPRPRRRARPPGARSRPACRFAQIHDRAWRSRTSHLCAVLNRSAVAGPRNRRNDGSSRSRAGPRSYSRRISRSRERAVPRTSPSHDRPSASRASHAPRTGMSSACWSSTARMRGSAARNSGGGTGRNPRFAASAATTRPVPGRPGSPSHRSRSVTPGRFAARHSAAAHCSSHASGGCGSPTARSSSTRPRRAPARSRRRRPPVPPSARPAGRRRAWKRPPGAGSPARARRAEPVLAVQERVGRGELPLHAPRRAGPPPGGTRAEGPRGWSRRRPARPRRPPGRGRGAPAHPPHHPRDRLRHPARFALRAPAPRRDLRNGHAGRASARGRDRWSFRSGARRTGRTGTVLRPVPLRRARPRAARRNPPARAAAGTPKRRPRGPRSRPRPVPPTRAGRRTRSARAPSSCARTRGRRANPVGTKRLGSRGSGWNSAAGTGSTAARSASSARRTTTNSAAPASMIATRNRPSRRSSAVWQNDSNAARPDGGTTHSDSSRGPGRRARWNRTSTRTGGPTPRGGARAGREREFLRAHLRHRPRDRFHRPLRGEEQDRAPSGTLRCARERVLPSRGPSTRSAFEGDSTGRPNPVRRPRGAPRPAGRPPSPTPRRRAARGAVGYRAEPRLPRRSRATSAASLRSGRSNSTTPPRGASARRSGSNSPQHRTARVATPGVPRVCTPNRASAVSDSRGGRSSASSQRRPWASNPARAGARATASGTSPLVRARRRASRFGKNRAGMPEV